MGIYDIHLEKLDTLCDLLDASGIEGNVIHRLNPCDEPSIRIWKVPYDRLFEKGFDSSDILFKIYWWPLSEKYALHVLNKEYAEQIKSLWQSECGMPNIYLFKTPRAMVDTIKILFSHKENNMNKDQKREEAIRNLIKELTSKKIYWTSMGVVRGYPTLRIYNEHGHENIADIYVMGTNSDDAYVYAIEPLKFKFREQLKNNKYKCVYTEPRTDNWYVYLRPSTAACVIKDYLTAHAVSESKGYSYDNRDRIKDVIFNDPATIVFWGDGTKTVVQAVNEPFDPEKGLAMAICRKAFGNKHDYYDVFKKYVGRYEKKQKKG